MDTTPEPKVIIIGAGLSGLAIAQGLKRHGIDFEIFEKEAVPRDRNWGVTVCHLRNAHIDAYLTYSPS